MKLSKRLCILISALAASLGMADPAAEPSSATPAPQAEPSAAAASPTASPLATKPVAADEPSTAAPVPDKGLITRIVEGGWVMWPIGACSVLTLYLIGNGIYHTLGRRVAPAEHKDALKHLFIDGKYAESSLSPRKASPTSPLPRRKIFLGSSIEIAKDSGYYRKSLYPTVTAPVIQGDYTGDHQTAHADQSKRRRMDPSCLRPKAPLMAAEQKSFSSVLFLDHSSSISGCAPYANFRIGSRRTAGSLPSK
ncbi:MAG: hypothetical protein ACFUZC_11455 [Chthoniobacteraceae bacterium]